MFPLSDITTGKSIRILLDKMVNILLQRQYDDLPGLLIGNSGIILFLSYYSKHIKDGEEIYNRIEELIYKVIEQCNLSSIPSSLGTGLSGIGWSFNKLMQIGLLDEELQQVVDEMACSTETDMIANLEACRMDLMYGFMGQYIFLSECGLMKNAIREQVHHFFTRNNLVSDFKRFLAEEGKTTNLGLAHGLPGLGLFLHHHSLSDGLLNDVVKQILNVAKARSLYDKKKRRDFFSLFPNSADLDALSGSLFQSSRYAWCYGDLGILYFLAVLKNKGYENRKLGKTIELLLTSCNERNLNNAAVAYLEETGCYDIGFCHGLSGIFYLQQKINSLLPSTRSLDTSGYWLNHFLNHLTVFMEKEQFTAGKGTDKGYDPLSIIEGLPGAGLVLISYLTGDTSWDSCLMLDCKWNTPYAHCGPE